MAGRPSKLNAQDIRTAEDLVERMDELIALSEQEKFLLVFTILGQLLPHRGRSYADAAKKTDAAGNTQPGQLEKREYSADEVERQRSVVVCGLPEPGRELRGEERMRFEWRNIWDLLEELDFSCFPVSVFRLGFPKADRPRLLKLVLPTSAHQQMLLRSARKLRNCIKFQNVFIRPSLTREERRVAYALRQQRRHLLETQGGRYRIGRDCLFDLTNKISIPLDQSFYPAEKDKLSNVTLRKKILPSRVHDPMGGPLNSLSNSSFSGGACICQSCSSPIAPTTASLN